MVLCEEWWEITKDTASSLFDLYKIHREASTRKTLRRAMIVECFVIVITAYLLQKDQDLET